MVATSPTMITRSQVVRLVIRGRPNLERVGGGTIGGSAGPDVVEAAEVEDRPDQGGGGDPEAAACPDGAGADPGDAEELAADPGLRGDPVDVAEPAGPPVHGQPGLSPGCPSAFRRNTGGSGFSSAVAARSGGSAPLSADAPVADLLGSGDGCSLSGLCGGAADGSAAAVGCPARRLPAGWPDLGLLARSARASVWSRSSTFARLCSNTRRRSSSCSLA